jgi:hypothetical protein
MTYCAPVADIAFTLKHSAGFAQALEDGIYGDLDADTVDAVLEEAGKFATDVIAPLNTVGDRFGTPFKDGAVTTPPAGTALPRRRNSAARTCRRRSTRPASKCGTRPRWRSASARC